MAFCIKKFSAWFCFMYSTEEKFELDSEYLQLSVNTKRFKDIIGKLFEMYRDEIMPVIDKILNTWQCHCLYSFMKPILSICVELSKNPTILHFMLVCTFIRGIISRRFRKQNKCFTFVKIASQCLQAVYIRSYKDLFETADDPKTFESYCKTLNTILEQRMTAKGRRTLPPFNEEELRTLMTDLKDFEDEDFQLTNAENKMVLETYYSFFPDEDYSTETDDLTGRSLSETLSNESGLNEFLLKKPNAIKIEPEEMVKEEISSNEFESDGGILRQASAIKTEPMEMGANDEADVNRSNVYWEVEAYTNESSEIDLQVKTNTNRSEIVLKVKTNESESAIFLKMGKSTNQPEVFIKEETNVILSEPDDTVLKEEICSDEAESDDASLKENDLYDCECNRLCWNAEANSSESSESMRANESDSDDTNQICNYCGLPCFVFVSEAIEILMKKENNL